MSAKNRTASIARAAATATAAETRKTTKSIKRIIYQPEKHFSSEWYVSIVQNRHQMFQPFVKEFMSVNSAACVDLLSGANQLP